MTEEQIAMVNEPIEYCIINGEISSGHLRERKGIVFGRIDAELFVFSIFNPIKFIAKFKVTKWKQ